MQMALEIHNLTKDYGDFCLQDVSFSLPRGYIMGLIGPNGAGKTTLIKLILNLIRKDGGRVDIFGRDNLREEVAVKQQIGFVHDYPLFYEYLSLERNKAAISPFYNDWNDGLFHKLAGEFNLPLKKRVSRLSRGMRMKFALCLALCHNADLIIMDEPTSGLDPVFRRELLKILSAILQDEQKSIIFSTHITSDLERIADYITYLRDGRLMFSSSRETILTRWCLVKGDNDLLTDQTKTLFRGWRRGEYGFEGLADDREKVQAVFKDNIILEKIRLEDILYFMR